MHNESDMGNSKVSTARRIRRNFDVYDTHVDE
jgi:hypothetical protein